jgi:hypothetical protein
MLGKQVTGYTGAVGQARPNGGCEILTMEFAKAMPARASTKVSKTRGTSAAFQALRVTVVLPPHVTSSKR